MAKRTASKSKRSKSAKKSTRKASRPAAKKSARKAAKKKARRTTMYSRGGKKLYAKRSASGRFKDIQTYKRAHGMDIKRKSAAEEAAASATAESSAREMTPQADPLMTPNDQGVGM